MPQPGLQFLARATFQDDRGQTCRLISLRYRDHTDDPDLAATLSRIGETKTTGMWATKGWLAHVSFKRLMVTLSLVGVFVTIPILVFAVIKLDLTTATAPIAFVVYFAICMGGVMLLSRLNNTIHRDMVLNSLLRIGRCPGCAYDLRATLPATPLPSDPNSPSLIVCPECNAAWRTHRVGHAPVVPLDRPVQADIAGDTPPIGGWIKRIALRTPTIRDDRNCSVRRIELDLPGLERDIGDDGANAIRNDIANATRARRYILGLAVGILGIACFTIIGISQYLGGAAAGPTLFRVIEFAYWIWITAFLILTSWRIVTGRSRGSNKHVVQILRRHHLCPSCAKPLAGAPIGPDGCAVCTRCHAAWRVAPPTAPPETPTTTAFPS